MSAGAAVRARVYLRDSARSGDRPAYEVIAEAFREAGIVDVSVHRGILGFDRSSGLLSDRPLRFHPDLPVVVEATGERARVEAALPRVRAALPRGLITLSEVTLLPPGGA
ncbi:hypothetical protein Rxycam_02581 [Rubrobacter xylanophilus DSM 9941]|uniref:DUF190 domain-containing protein n=1 Tax=Rubrobacter xylanophilus TaxID=49319 RepID=UPI001C641F53|nr:DUF190 domain-containing protein [Rubrobacter xylanophilus]QYJ16746.1 hypothetical protein Rxycam_02581 [Rubrobacter xylanophilus DSM 9941]